MSKRTRHNAKQNLDRERGLVAVEPAAPPALGRMLPGATGRPALEGFMARLQRAIERQDLETEDDLNAFLERVNQDPSLLDIPAETPLEEAQELIYQAREMDNSRERIKLAKRALQISPDCADAYVLLATETARSELEARDLLLQAVAAGERAIGPEAFEATVGHFWADVTTRPYMRARQELASRLWLMGDHQAAIAHARDMLRLNPGDNQGVRYILIDWLLTAGDGEGVRGLLQEFPDDIGATFAYARVLLEFRRTGDSREARAALRQAQRANPYVPKYLTGQGAMPEDMPPFVGLGDEAEAVVCAASQLSAWMLIPESLGWLGERTGLLRRR